MTTGEKIREARKDCGLTQREFSKRIGIAEPTLRKYESNKLNPKIETLLKISAAADCDLAFLLPDELVDAYFAGATRTYDEIRRNQVKDEDIEELSEGLSRIFDAYEILNDYGQQEAVKRVEELTEIPRYRRTDAPPAPSEGKDPTPTAKPTEGPQGGK